METPNIIRRTINLAMPKPPDREPDDVLIQNSTVHLSWLDRLRVLFGRPIRLHSSTKLWFRDEPYLLPGRTETRTSVDRIFPRKPMMVTDELRLRAGRQS